MDPNISGKLQEVEDGIKYGSFLDNDDKDDPVQLSDLVENCGIRLYHAFILVLCCIMLMCPATANHAIPLLIDTIKAEYRLDHTAAATIGSGVLLGSVIGVLVFGWLNDKIGRKRSTLIAIFGIGLCEVAHLYLPWEGGQKHGALYWKGFVMLFGLRILLGVFFGGVAGYANLMLIEVLPSMHRGMVMTVMGAGWSCGTLLSLSLVSNMEQARWRSTLAAPAFFCVSAAIICMAFCPESPRWLFVVGREEEAREVLRHIVQSPVLLESPWGRVDRLPSKIVISTGFISAETPRTLISSRTDYNNYMDRHLVLVVFGAILIQVSVQGASYGSFVWMPKLLQDLLSTSETHYDIFAYSEVLGTASSIACAVFLDTYGRKKALLCIITGWLITTGMMAMVPRTYTWVMSAFMLQQCVSSGIWPAMMVYCAECFPTVLRGTLGALCQGCGRMSAVVAPILLGAMLDGKIDTSQAQARAQMPSTSKIETALFSICGMLMIGVVGALSIPRETANIKMDDV